MAEPKVFVVMCHLPNRRWENTLEVVCETARAGQFHVKTRDALSACVLAINAWGGKVAITVTAGAPLPTLFVLTTPEEPAFLDCRVSDPDPDPPPPYAAAAAIAVEVDTQLRLPLPPHSSYANANADAGGQGPGTDGE